MFFLCFIPLFAAGSLWLLFAPRWRAAHALPLSLLIGLVFLCARARFFAPIGFDEEGFLFDGWLVTNGSVPYRDFFEAKPPVIFFANALGLAVFGLKGFLFRIIPTAIAVSSIFLFYPAMIKRRVVPLLAGLLAAQVALWLLGSDFHDTGLNDSETYGFALTLLGFSFVSLSDGRPGSPGKVALQVLGGICFGLAVLSKELFVLSVIPAWLMAARLAKTAKWDWRRLMFSAAGGLVTGLIFVTYLATHSAFLRYLDLLRFYRTFAANYCIDVGRFPKVSGLAVLLPSWNMLHEQLYNLNHLAFVLSLGSAFLLFLWRRPRGTGRWIDVAIVTLAVVLGMIAVSVGHCFWRHYFFMGMTGLILLSVAGAEAVSGYLAERRPGFSVPMAIVLSGLFIYVAAGPVRTALAAKPTLNSGPDIPQIVTETIDKHSKPGDYVLMTESPLVYIVTNRKSPLPIAFFLDDILPYDPTLHIDALQERLEQYLPKVCYFGSSLSARQTTFRRLLFEPLLAEHYYIKVRDDLWYLPESVQPSK